MKLKYLVSFDPEVVAPKDVKAALVSAGLIEDDIKLAGVRETPAAPKTKPKAVGKTGA